MSKANTKPSVYDYQTNTPSSADTPAPSLIESRGSIATAPSPASPPDLYDYTTTNPEIKQEPHDSPFSDFQHSFDALDGKQHMPALAPLLDETQHSAAMLCDLPCPSSARARPTASNPPLPLPSPAFTTLPWTLTLLATLNLSFLHTYRTLLQAMRTPSPPSSRPARPTSASRRPSTSPSTSSSPPTASRMPRREPSATALAQRNAATAVAGSPSAPEGFGGRSSSEGGRVGGRGENCRTRGWCDDGVGGEGREERESQDRDDGVGRLDRMR